MKKIIDIKNFLDNNSQLGLNTVTDVKLTIMRNNLLKQILVILKNHILNLQIKRDLKITAQPDNIVTVFLKDLEEVFTVKMLKSGEEAKEFGKEISSQSELYKALINRKILDSFSYFSKRGLKIEGVITNIKEPKIKKYSHYYKYVPD